MDYFNDIWFRSVSKMITSRNGTRSAALYGAIGIMAGGKAILCIGNGEFELEAPFLYWSYPGESYCWKTPPGEIRENLWVSASGTRFERMLGALDRISPDRRYLFLKKTEMLINTFERMRECFERDTAFHRRRLPLYLEELMVHLADALEANDLVSGRMEKAVMHLTTRIVRSPAAALDLEQEAAKYAVSADYLRHCFKQVNGISPYEFQLSQRYALAIRLLRETELPVGEIGDRCGFPVHRLFTQFIRKRSGFAPRELRKYM